MTTPEAPNTAPKPTPQEILEALPDDEVAALKASYHDRVNNALALAENYRGSEPEFEGVMTTLVDLERWLAENFSSQDDQRLSAANETMVNQLLNGTNSPGTIDDIMALAGERFAQIMEGGGGTRSVQELIAELNIHRIRLRGTILRPANIPVRIGQRQPEEENAPAGRPFVKLQQPKFQQLIAFLNRHSIFTDDILVCDGDLEANQMRETSYYIVEIPRINKEILICNQAGEATFVINGIIRRETILACTKDELQNRFAGRITKIDYDVPHVWEAKLTEALYHQQEDDLVSVAPRKKVNISTYEAARQELQRSHTAKKWLAIKGHKRRELTLGDAKYTAMGTILGIQTDSPFSEDTHLEMAAVIYGEDHPDIIGPLGISRRNRQKTLEFGTDLKKWKAAFRKEHSYEKWSKMTPAEKANFDFYGNSLHMLGRLFNIVEPDSADHRTLFDELTLVFFEEDMPADEVTSIKEKIATTKATERKKLVMREDSVRLTPEQYAEPEFRLAFIETIKKLYTAEAWLQLNQEQKRDLMIDGLLYTTISTLIRGEVVDHPFSNDNHIQLGAASYGAEDPEIAKVLPAVLEKRAKVEELGKNPDKWRAAILKAYPFAKWMAMTGRARQDFALFGQSLEDLANIFGIKRDIYHNGGVRPATIQKEFLRLTLEIYKNVIPPDESKKIEEEVHRLTEEYNARAALRLGKVKGDSEPPAQPNGVQLMDKNAWLEAMRTSVTAAELIATSPYYTTEKKYKGCSIKEIAAFLGIETEEKKLNRSGIVEFAGMLFGEDDPSVIAARKRIAKFENPDKVAAELRARHTWTEWKAMNFLAKKAFDYDGLDLREVGQIFKVKGNPVDYHHIHIKIGAAIFTSPENQEDQKDIKKELEKYDKQKELGTDPDKWRVAINGLYKKEEWESWITDVRRTKFVYGRGITFLAGVFGIVSGDTLSSNAAYAELLQKIFG